MHGVPYKKIVILTLFCIAAAMIALLITRQAYNVKKPNPKTDITGRLASINPKRCLSFSISAGRNTIQQGEDITVSYTLTNTSKKTLFVIVKPIEQIIAMRIVDDQGQCLSRWGDNKDYFNPGDYLKKQKTPKVEDGILLKNAQTHTETINLIRWIPDHYGPPGHEVCAFSVGSYRIAAFFIAAVISVEGDFALLKKDLQINNLSTGRIPATGELSVTVSAD